MTRKVESASLNTLKIFLPEGTFLVVHSYLIKYKVELTITRARKSVLGDYRRPHKGKGHRITINGDLNLYAFLLTMMHELAHLLAFEFYGNKIAPHGKEWRHTFKNIMNEIDVSTVLPQDVAHAVQQYMLNPAARSCSDDHLARTLRKYDYRQEGICLVEDLEEGDKFRTPGGECFKRGRKLRKRYECRSLKTGHLYIFSPIYEVKKVNK